jgi:penicillin amidase
VIRAGFAAILLAALLFAGFRPVGPVPPLGSLLDPANGAWATARSANLPATQQIVMRQVTKPVQVLFDDRGVPHIFAANEEDAYRALGYVMARDRLFQMELQTMATAGRLTEWLGARALDADRESRAAGLVWGAERKLAAYDTSSLGYRAIRAYAEGVNAWISSMRTRDLPIEYRLLNIVPHKWEPIHSFYFFGRMALTLGFNDASLKHLAAQAKVGKAAADALFPVNSPIQEPVQPNGLTTPRYAFTPIPAPGSPDSAAMVALGLRRGIDHAFALGVRDDDGDAIGSNNWAVSPKRSATRNALLAGDPHLDLTLPSVWYEMHIVVPGRLDVAGVGFPGVPGVIIGFNRDVAWTFTNTSSDVNDYYVESVDNEAHPSSYRLDGRWRPLEKRLEVYRGKSTEVLRTDTIFYTHRGPMVRKMGKWMSMRWTVLEPSHEQDNFLRLGYAHSAREWLDAMRDFVGPTQNGLVADRSGNIAIRSSGAYPIRPGDGRGDVIRDGRVSANDWVGMLPVEKYPFSMNPAQGFLSSANQQPVDPRDNSSYFGSDWYSPWRAMRINSLLRADSSMTPEKMRRMQTDPGSARADAFVPEFLAASDRQKQAGRSDARLERAARLLAEWDRRYTKENKRAVLFEMAMDELTAATWDELDSDSKPRRESRPTPQAPETQILLSLLKDPTNAWWDDRRTAARETRDDIVTASLRNALGKAERMHGNAKEAGWKWSSVRHANIYHLLRLPAFSRLDLPVQSGPSTLSPSGGRGTQGASWRMVVELGPEVQAWGTYPGGQSGNPSSARYADRLPNWLNGRLDPILFPKTAADLSPKRVISALTIVPRQ